MRRRTDRGRRKIRQNTYNARHFEKSSRGEEIRHGEISDGDGAAGRERVSDLSFAAYTSWGKLGRGQRFVVRLVREKEC
jgi:hypothetical protein